MEGIKRFLRGEPVAVTTLVSAVIALAVVFGLSLPAGAEAAIIAVVVAVSAMFARSKVSPVEA
jgi:hypothetical protein